MSCVNFQKISIFNIVLLCLISLTSGCIHNQNKALTLQTETNLYNDAINLFHAKKYKEAIKNFDEIETLYPFSYWAMKGQLMSAIASYKIGNYSNAVFYLDNYIHIYPNSESIEYAYYLRVLSQYMQVKDVDLDQTAAYKALELSGEFVQLFPSSKYLQRVKNKQSSIRQHLSAKEFSIGKFYLNRGEYVAAIKRFNTVLKEYNDTDYLLPESLYRLSESYLALGNKDEAKKYVLLLQKDFPKSHWYTSSLNLINVG